jgi:hypothetical protein
MPVLPTINPHHVHRQVYPPCVRFASPACRLLGSLRIRGTHRRWVRCPVCIAFRGDTLPLSAFFSHSHFSRRYVSHPSTRPLTLRWPDGITIPGLSRDVAAVPDLGEQRSTGRFLSSETSDAFDTRVFALSPWSIVAWISSHARLSRYRKRVKSQAHMATTICSGDHATMRRKRSGFPVSPLHIFPCHEQSRLASKVRYCMTGKSVISASIRDLMMLQYFSTSTIADFQISLLNG